MFDPLKIRSITEKVATGEYRLAIPANERDLNLNDINIAAYTVLKEDIYNLTPRDIQFLGSMTRTNFVSVKQRKYLRDLLKRHVGIDLN